MALGVPDGHLREVLATPITLVVDVIVSTMASLVLLCIAVPGVLLAALPTLLVNHLSAKQMRSAAKIPHRRNGARDVLASFRVLVYGLPVFFVFISVCIPVAGVLVGNMIEEKEDVSPQWSWALLVALPAVFLLAVKASDGAYFCWQRATSKCAALVAGQERMREMRQLRTTLADRLTSIYGPRGDDEIGAQLTDIPGDAVSRETGRSATSTSAAIPEDVPPPSGTADVVQEGEGEDARESESEDEMPAAP